MSILVLTVKTHGKRERERERERERGREGEITLQNVISKIDSNGCVSVFGS